MGNWKRADSPQINDSVLEKHEEVHRAEVKGIKLSNPFNQIMIKEGLALYELTFAVCHRLTSLCMNLGKDY
jgi:hypothetical protein